ncbi:hypothetical protein VTN96DRAFT_7361 [Rasamsonia emersonii]
MTRDAKRRHQRLEKQSASNSTAIGRLITTRKDPIHRGLLKSWPGSQMRRDETRRKDGERQRGKQIRSDPIRSDQIGTGPGADEWSSCQGTRVLPDGWRSGGRRGAGGRAEGLSGQSNARDSSVVSRGI